MLFLERIVLYLAANCSFFRNLRYYDVLEAIKTAVNELGAINTVNFCRAYSSFFVEYRSKDYQKLPIDVFCYENALKALAEYKNLN